MRLPVRLGGWGLRSLEETSLAAFLGAVPAFPGPEGSALSWLSIWEGRKVLGGQEKERGDGMLCWSVGGGWERNSSAAGVG